jgi:hypothetical protein
VHDARARPGRGVRRGAAGPRDGVGDPEADAEHAGQLIRAPAHDLVRALAVVLGDPGHEPREPVRREQQVQRPAGAQLVPRLHRLVRALRVEAERAERAARVVVDRVEDAVAVAVQQLRRAAGAHVLDALEVREERGVARRRERLRRRDLDLHPEAAVVLPHAGDAHALALLEVRDQPDQDELVAVALGIDDGEAGLLARVAPSPDRDLALERAAGHALDHRHDDPRRRGGEVRPAQSSGTCAA